MTTAEGVSSGEVFLQDEQAALSLTAGLTFDFRGGRGEEKPAKLLLVMDRQSLEPIPL